MAPTKKREKLRTVFRNGIVGHLNLAAKPWAFDPEGPGGTGENRVAIVPSESVVGAKREPPNVPIPKLDTSNLVALW